MTKHATDILLFKRIKAGSIEGFTALYDCYWEELFVYAYKVLADKAPAEDLIQELFLHIWDKRQSIQIETNLRGYLYKSLKNRIYNLIKANAIRHNHYRQLLNEMDQVIEDHSVSIEQKENSRFLALRLEELPGKMKEIAKLYLMEELNIKEISRYLSLSEHTVRSQLNNGRKRLRSRK